MLQNTTNNGLKLLGVLIRYNRNQKGLSLRQLAKLSNMSHTLISTIETGKVVPNKDTLIDLFNVLDIDFYDSDVLKNDFNNLSKKLKRHLFNYEFEEAKGIAEAIFKHENEYQNSPLLIEYTLVKYLYLVLPFDKTINYDAQLATLESVFEYLTNEQKQMWLFIKGVNFSNTRRFNKATEYLLQARKLGDHHLEPYINAIITYAYVHRYMFMDAIETGRATILELEKIMNYKWAMDVRLSLGKAFSLVRRFDKAKELYDKVRKFAYQYDVALLQNKCDLFTAEMYHRKNDLEMARHYIQKVFHKGIYYYYAAMHIYGKLGDKDRIIDMFKTIQHLDDYQFSYRSRLIFAIMKKMFILEDRTSEEYAKQLEEVLDISFRGEQQETIEVASELLMEYYHQKRQYKRAFEYCEQAYKVRRYGVDYLSDN
ncbi:MAG: helix-turn-helix domain-containing protein [Candidatus Izimaplasma sp.]|nr:helix-turn-helix domain-containing protein [Candidatus Izimaplasma bacterium]